VLKYYFLKCWIISHQRYTTANAMCMVNILVV